MNHTFLGAICSKALGVGLFDMPETRGSDPAVAQLGFKNFERQPKGFHQSSAFISDSAVNLNAEAIAEFSMLLQVVLDRGLETCALKASSLA